MLALAGSLGLGVVLAFLFQYISDFKISGVTILADNQKTPLRERQETVTQHQVSKDPVNDQKKPSRGKRSSRKTHSNSAEQESTNVEGKRGSTETKEV